MGALRIAGIRYTIHSISQISSRQTFCLPMLQSETVGLGFLKCLLQTLDSKREQVKKAFGVEASPGCPCQASFRAAWTLRPPKSEDGTQVRQHGGVFQGDRCLQQKENHTSGVARPHLRLLCMYK